jgi:hypothetical protein
MNNRNNNVNKKLMLLWNLCNNKCKRNQSRLILKIKTYKKKKNSKKIKIPVKIVKPHQRRKKSILNRQRNKRFSRFIQKRYKLTQKRCLVSVVMAQLSLRDY